MGGALLTGYYLVGVHREKDLGKGRSKAGWKSFKSSACRLAGIDELVKDVDVGVSRYVLG